MKRKERRRRAAEQAQTRRPLQMLTGTERVCGHCQACCMIHRIDHVHKPPFQVCEHQCVRGCAIHETKPDECSGYQCAYRAGILKGGGNMRPDILGLMIDFRHPVGEGGSQFSNQVLVSVWEVWPGAAVDQIEYLMELCRTCVHVVLTPFDARPIDKHRMYYVRLSESPGLNDFDNVIDARIWLQEAIPCAL